MNKPYIHGMLPDTSEQPVPHASSAEASPREIRFLGDMQRLQHQPGDVFVLTCEQRIDCETALCIREQVSAALGGAKVLVLDGGMKLGVVAAPSIAVDLATGPSQTGMAVVDRGNVVHKFTVGATTNREMLDVINEIKG